MLDNNMLLGEDKKELKCPICGSVDVSHVESNPIYETYECHDCEYTWRV